MAYGYWKEGVHNQGACFNLFFRKNPFGGGYAVACGIGTVIEFLRNYRFTDDDIEYLKTLEGNDKKPLFEEEFLQFIKKDEFRCEVYSIREGRLVFPFEPIIRVEGPLYQCQLIETALLNIINFETLIATKAARICHATDGDPVLEFGLRRAQGIDGSLSASRAAYVGGCAATSNVLAGKFFGIPVKGTHAHSWIMCFEDELAAFRHYARALPNNCVFLVDTYNTLEGVKHAVTVGKELAKMDYKMAGVRLDSGDLAYLSIEARRILDEGGFAEAKIFASNDLDERTIASLKQQGAKIAVWGVGTKLATAYDQPALGGVYKLSAVQDKPVPTSWSIPGHSWSDRVKLSEQKEKTSIPGIPQVYRFYESNVAVGDMIVDTLLPGQYIGPMTMIDPMDSTRRKVMGGKHMPGEALLRPIEEAYYNLRESRLTVFQDMDRFHSGVLRFMNPHQYPVGLSEALYKKREALILKLRGIE
jgi:nicotinate phosphoribosyltransferase